MDEEWRDVVGYEDHYEISNLGRVRSKDRKSISTDTILCQRKGKLLKPKGHRYFRIDLSKNGFVRTYCIHRLVAEAFLPNVDNLPEVDHLDRNKHNNIVSNLRWVSKVENQRNRGMPSTNTSGEMYIQFNYKVFGKKDGRSIQKMFSSLDDAKEYRKEIWGF